ncbi:S41 family peptidase [Paenibacillus sp. CAA11]|uniref:S41 family peptidase n=1 Tax=Paenibacillus sp. CAA11 TaxID=1532905 RepID=UPI001F33BF10|nr:S41 family peptidase [Paenibacillus sp. CAA11]
MSTKQAEGQLTTEQKLEDFEYMYKIIEENYPFLAVNKRMNNVDWLANKSVYWDRIKMTRSDQGFQRTIKQILKELNNGHTSALNTLAFQKYKNIYSESAKQGQSLQPWLDVFLQPKVLSRYTDASTSELKSSVDSEPSINTATATTEIIKDGKVAYIRIPTLDHNQIKPDIEIIQPFLEKVRNYQTLIIDIRGNSGGDSAYWSEYVVPMLSNTTIKYHWYLAFRGGKYSIPFIEAKYQRSFNQMHPISQLQQEKLPNLPPEILTDFTRYIKEERQIKPKQSVHFTGHIYLLVDRVVYSSSDMWANFAKQTGWATLVGESTGGDGLGWDPAMFYLPNSGIVIRLPLALGLRADGAIEDEVTVTPSILVTGSPEKDLTNDSAVLAVLKAEAERLKK